MQVLQTNLPPRLRQSLPDLNRLSVLMAVTSLAYTLTRILSTPGSLVWRQEWELLGTLFAIQLDMRFVASVVVAALTAAGADWLLHDHPGRADTGAPQEAALRWRRLPYLILPALSAGTIGFALNLLPFTRLWWLGLLLGGNVLLAILVAEYLSYGSGEETGVQPLAAAASTAILTAAAYVLFLVLVVSLSIADMRLYQSLPILFVGATLVSLRVMHLRLEGEWVIYEALLIAFVVAQLAAALSYWPLSPLRFGLFVFGLLAASVNLMLSLIDDRTLRQALPESMGILAALVLAGLVMG